MIKNFNQFIFESANTPTFFFDMDGVLADFDKGLEDDPRYEELKTKKDILFSYVESSLNKKVSTLEEVKALLNNDQELTKLYNEAHDLLHDIAEKKGFFLNLEPMEGAKEMLELAKDLTGNLPNILTAPVDSEYSAKEKIQWMKNHFDGMYNDVIVDKEKFKYATGSHDILVDDRSKYIESFKKAGGSIIHHTDSLKTMKEMKNLVS